MKFIKKNFLIRCKDKETDREYIKIVSGYTDENGLLGYDKRFYNIWTVTDLASGVFIISRKTRKLCVEDFYSYLNDAISAYRNTPHYAELVKAFNELKEKENV